MKVLGMSVMRGMCDGLGMTPPEWEEMRGMVDDSFWVMRVIGTWRGTELPTRGWYHRGVVVGVGVGIVVVVVHLLPRAMLRGLTLSPRYITP
jgi:hypothetical protein